MTVSLPIMERNISVIWFKKDSWRVDLSWSAKSDQLLNSVSFSLLDIIANVIQLYQFFFLHGFVKFSSVSVTWPQGPTEAHSFFHLQRLIPNCDAKMNLPQGATDYNQHTPPVFYTDFWPIGASLLGVRRQKVASHPLGQYYLDSDW